MFAHLNTHSTFSKMRGTASHQELLVRAQAHGQQYLALTEVNGLWGFIRFVQFAREAAIKPIAGTNILSAGEDTILLAESQQGYENLCRIISAVHDDAAQSVTDLLAKWKTGLFVLSHQETVLAKLARFMPETQLFVELRPGVTERHAWQLSRLFHLEIVATGDIYFLNPADQKTHKILRAIDKNKTLSQLDSAEYKSERHFFRSEKEMIKLFPNSLAAINNSQYLAERCKTDWNYVNTIFPGMSLKETCKANRQLRKLVYEGAKRRYREINERLKQRIEYELKLITQKGFAPYFLVVWDIVRQTKATIGRGSGAASVVSYCLFITQVDPIKYNLVFERFIHPERVDMPDIDVDFPWDERDDILDYIFKKYGNERTAMVSSQVFMQPRSAIREVAKVYGLSNEEIKAVTKRIGYFARKTQLLDWIRNDHRFKNLDLDDTLLQIIQQSEKIVGAFRISSVHPGGVIVVPDEIRKYVPVLTAPKGVQIVEWDKDQVEDAGLLKIDILGNRSLAVVRDTLKQIGLYRSEYMDYHKIMPIGDPQTEALMKAGRTMGVFYIESPATRQLLQKAGKVDFEHVVIYSSIIRPAANRFINIMLERIHGKSWKLLHPDLKCLSESYGIMVYEEQVSIVAREIAGFGYAESDYVRKVISRPALEHLVPVWKKKFVSGAVNRGYTQQLAETLWSMIESFSGYSFCKPHSASYAMLSFTCAYLKAHFPAEFLAAVISSQGGYYSAYAYLSEARRFGVKILPPYINTSWREYRGRKDRIRMGFMAIKKLQSKAIDAILAERKAGDFKSLNDFLVRVNIDLADAMALTNAGCFAELEPEMNHKEIAFKVANFYLQDGVGEPVQIPYSREPLTHQERITLEIESFGFPISEHPLKRYLPILGERIRKAEDIPKLVGQTINLAGVYITRKVTSTRQREPMEFVTFEDETDIFECVMFPDSYKEFGDLLNWESLFVIRGKVEVAFGVYTITVEKLGSLRRIVDKLTPKKDCIMRQSVITETRYATEW
ncbi:MAG TPA: DNA polymerase III subunit alpha [Candidatus Marinimicrobia bacterium]|nr:DNA polymerase III subunit alpha [Candidatus Neomarinimicrobiota bacterium]